MFKLEPIIMIFPSHKITVLYFISGIMRELIHDFSINKIPARILSGPMLLCPESIFHKRMRRIIFKLSHRQSLGTNRRIHTRPSWRNKQFIPHSKPVTSSTPIPNNIIQRMSYPNTTSFHISLYQRPYLSRINNKIILNKIMCLCAIFDKYSMSTDIISYGICYFQEMNSMDRCHTGKTFMNSITISVT